jgi:hypothetical protein
MTDKATSRRKNMVAVYIELRIFRLDRDFFRNCEMDLVKCAGKVAMFALLALYYALLAALLMLDESTTRVCMLPCHAACLTCRD